MIERFLYKTGDILIREIFHGKHFIVTPAHPSACPVPIPSPFIVSCYHYALSFYLSLSVFWQHKSPLVSF